MINRQIMKSIIPIIYILLISLNVFGQKIGYSIEAGINYNFFTKPYLGNETRESPTPTSYSDTILFSDLQISSSEKIGYTVKNSFTFSINNKFALKTGLNFSFNNIDSKVSDKSIKAYIDSESGNIIYQKNTYATDTLSNQIYESGTVSCLSCPNPKVLEAHYSLFFITVPLHIQRSIFKEKLLVSSGISISFILPFRKKFKSTCCDSPYFGFGQFKKVFYLIDFGIDYKVHKNIYIGIDYSQSIANSYTNYKVPNWFDYGYDSSIYFYPGVRTVKNIMPKKHKLNNISLNVSYMF